MTRPADVARLAKQPWDVIVVGGGVIGGAVAFEAASRSLRVLVLEGDQIAAAQSGRNLGFVRQQGRDFRELALMREAIALWPLLEARLGRNIGWVQGGNLALAADDRALGTCEAWQRRARGLGLDTRVLTAQQARSLVPALASVFACAIYTASDGKADPVRTTQAFHLAAQAKGATLVVGVTVDALVMSGARVDGVRVGDVRLRSDRVVCAAGLGTRKLLATAGLFLPQSGVRATVIRTAPAAAAIDPCISGPTIGIRQDTEGRVNVSIAGGEHDVTWQSFRDLPWFGRSLLANRHAVTINPFAALRRRRPSCEAATVPGLVTPAIAPRPNPSKARKALAELTTLLPAFAGLPVDALWAGLIEATPDMIPAVGTISGSEGLLVAAGFSGHGFGPAPAVGQALARMLTGGDRPASLSALSPDRFARGAWSATPDMQ